MQQRPQEAHKALKYLLSGRYRKNLLTSGPDKESDGEDANTVDYSHVGSIAVTS